MLMLLCFELMLVIYMFWNLKLFADVTETDWWLQGLVVVVVVVVVAVSLSRGCVTPDTVAIGNTDVSGCSRRWPVGRYDSSQLVDNVRMRMI